MRCISCECLSWNIICKECQTNLLQASFNKRELENDFFVYNFYEYEEIKNLISTKYKFHGDRVFNILAKLAFKKFSNNFNFTTNVVAIPIDDHTRHGFSQSAILARYLKSKNIKPIYNTLKATNIVKFAGKDLEFRQNNQRNFIYTGTNNLQVILVDDLVTTGLTILEAKECLENHGCEVLFALTLSDARV